MALTEAKIKDLKAKKFDQLYEDKKSEWVAMAKVAKAHTKANITDGQEPRPDDISKALHPMLEVHQALRDHQEDNQAKAPRFVEWFVEYVIDMALLQSKPGG